MDRTKLRHEPTQGLKQEALEHLEEIVEDYTLGVDERCQELED